jgi:hypothetical protein
MSRNKIPAPNSKNDEVEATITYTKTTTTISIMHICTGDCPASQLISNTMLLGNQMVSLEALCLGMVIYQTPKIMKLKQQ